jgi:hypothetical protein
MAAACVTKTEETPLPMVVSAGGVALLSVAFAESARPFLECASGPASSWATVDAEHQAAALDRLRDQLPNGIFLLSSVVRIAATTARLVANNYALAADSAEVRAYQRLSRELEDVHVAPLVHMWKAHTGEAQPRKVEIAERWLGSSALRSLSTTRKERAPIPPSAVSEAPAAAAAELSPWTIEDDEVRDLVEKRSWDELTTLIVHSWVEAATIEDRAVVLRETALLLPELLDRGDEQFSMAEALKPTCLNASLELSNWLYLLTHIVLIATDYGTAFHVETRTDAEVGEHWARLEQTLTTWFCALKKRKARERQNRELLLEVAACLLLLAPSIHSVPFDVTQYVESVIWPSFERPRRVAARDLTLLPATTFYPNQPLAERVYVRYHFHFLLALLVALYQRSFWRRRYAAASNIDRHLSSVGRTAPLPMRAVVDVGPSSVGGWVQQAREALGVEGYVLLRDLVPREVLRALASRLQALGHREWMMELSTTARAIRGDEPPVSCTEGSQAIAEALNALFAHDPSALRLWEVTAAAGDGAAEGAHLAVVQNNSELVRNVSQLCRNRVLPVRRGVFLRCKPADVKEGFSQPHADYFAYQHNGTLFGPLSRCDEFSENSDEVCRICKQTESHAQRGFRDTLLVCDLCQAPVHNTCLPDPFVTLPTESAEWHCPHCANERALPAFTVWIPLQPLQSHAESMLCVIPGSHRWKGYDDALAQELVAPGQYLASTDQREWHCPSHMNVGDAILFNIKTVHGATANASTNARFSLDIRFADGELTTTQKDATTAVEAATSSCHSPTETRIASSSSSS